MTGTLYLVATPIGNLHDISFRAVETLRKVDLIACEDTRHSLKLLNHYGIRNKLLSYHEHNEAARSAELLPKLVAGARVALVTDAGMPAISDPGTRLISASLEAGVPVTVLPGPSAVETALVAAGFVAERYQFLGYLPRGDKAVAALWEELRGWPWPTVAFESPRRLPASLRLLVDTQPDRDVAVCRELTKQFEEIVRGTAATVASRFREPPKGEITLVLGPGEEDARDEREAAAAVAELVASGLARRQAAP